MLPFVQFEAAGIVPVVLVGLDREGLLGFDPAGIDFWRLDPEDVRAVVSTSPAAVFHGIDAAWSQAELRAVANRGRRVGLLKARGGRFPSLPEGVLSGFPVAKSTLLRHRMRTPSVETIIATMAFALSTVRASIEEAEVSYACFAEAFVSGGRVMPEKSELVTCFRGLQNQKSEWFRALPMFAPEVRTAIDLGYRDRELRELLALDVGLPPGLGVAKLSFTLALLGHDCVCLDTRLMGRIFPEAKRRNQVESIFGAKTDGRVTRRALASYENVEDAFLEGNRHYDPGDPLGRARAQWLSWEAVGEAGATHEVWLRVMQQVA